MLDRRIKYGIMDFFEKHPAWHRDNTEDNHALCSDSGHWVPLTLGLDWCSAQSISVKTPGDT